MDDIPSVRIPGAEAHQAISFVYPELCIAWVRVETSKGEGKLGRGRRNTEIGGERERGREVERENMALIKRRKQSVCVGL